MSDNGGSIGSAKIHCRDIAIDGNTPYDSQPANNFVPPKMRVSLTDSIYLSESKNEHCDLAFGSSVTADTVDGPGELLSLDVDEISKGEVMQVIFCVPDTFICGVCSKQLMDLTSFLHHKSEHTISNDMYKCELCTLIVQAKTELLQHYASFHQAILLDESPTWNFGSELTSKPNIMDIPVEGDAMDAVVDADTIVSTAKWRPVIKVEPGRSHGSCQSEGQVLAGVQEQLGDAPLLNGQHALSLEPDAPKARKSLGAKRRNKLSTSVKTKSVAVKNSDHHYHALEEDFAFVLQDDLLRLKQHWNRNILQCLHCEFKSRRRDLLVTHMKQSHSEMLQSAGAAAKMAEQEAANKQQTVMKMSDFETKMRQTSRFRKRRIRKVEKQDQPGIFPCNQCTKLFSRLRYLRKHQEVHRTDAKHTCEACGKSFKCRTYLRVHAKTHEEKTFRCNQCEFESSINAAIHAHRQIHNHGSVLCDTCGYAYSDKSTLAKHKRVHDMNRPFACYFPGCTWRFNTEIMCRAHIRAHTTKGKFKCSACGYVFRHKHHLQRHEANMHGMAIDKSRNSNPHKSVTMPTATMPLSTDHVEEDNGLDQFVISPDLGVNEGSLQIETQSGLETSFLVVATEGSDSAEVMSYQTSDLSTLSSSTYQTLIGQGQDMLRPEEVDNGIVVNGSP